MTEGKQEEDEERFDPTATTTQVPMASLLTFFFPTRRIANRFRSLADRVPREPSRGVWRGFDRTCCSVVVFLNIRLLRVLTAARTANPLTHSSQRCFVFRLAFGFPPSSRFPCVCVFLFMFHVRRRDESPPALRTKL